MKTILLAAIASTALLLSACNKEQVKAKIEADIVHSVAVAVAPVAKPDLEKAARDSAAAGDTEGAGCAQAVAGQLDVLTAPGAGGACLNPLTSWNPATGKCEQTVIGFATAIAQQRIAARAAPPAPIRIPDSVIKACAVVVFDLNVSFAEFFAQLGIDATKFGLGANLGSAQTLSLVRAAEAAAAAQAAKP